MKRTLLAALIAAMSVTGSQAQVENRALRLTTEGTVDCGVTPELNGIGSFTVQMWVNPTQWAGTLLERGSLKVALGGTKDVTVTVGSLQLTAAAKGAGTWQQLTVINYKGNVSVLVDGTQVATKSGAPKADRDARLTLGGGYEGLIDEVRVWNIGLQDSYGHFWNNTLNEFNDLAPYLIAYYKMDHEEWTTSLADYKAIWTGGATNHHGKVSGGTFVAAENAKLPYLLNGAYTANERFYDREIEREAYLLSNDIINLGIRSFSDGHLEYSSPCNHATLGGTATTLGEFGGRTGVLSLDGGGQMESPALTLTDYKTYTVEGWIYVDEWTEGATIMRKGEVSGSNGFSITLGGADKKKIEVKVAGERYVFVCGEVSQGRGKPTVDALPLQQWVYLGLSVNGSGTVAGAYNMTCGGYAVTASTTESAATGKTEIAGADGKTVVWGEGFKGKMDQMAVFNTTFGNDAMVSHGNSYMMPGIKKLVTSMPMQKASAMYLFDDAANPGYDTYSQDEWLKIMRSAFDGYRGYQMRISVKSHDGWENTITQYAARQRFANDLAVLAAPYDGVELDLEWSYANQWETFGQLLDLIRAALPAEKTLMVSCHNVTYNFVPKNRYEKCDGFTFQQYGPQQTHFTWSKFESSAKAFVNNGYPKEKIYLSYATTTSQSTTGQAIKGIRNGALEQTGYTPSQDCDEWPVEGAGTFSFMSPIQVYRRAQYVTDNGLQGIFYWDMGNDMMDYRHPYHFAKMASYGLNANVDRIVSDATPAHPTATGIDAIDPDAGGESGVESVGLDLNDAPAYDLQGRRVTGTQRHGLIIQGGRKVLR